MSSFTIEKKGQTIEFQSRFDNLEDVRSYLTHNVKYNDFVESLLAKRNVTIKQESWMHYLATQDLIDSETPIEFGPYKQLVNTMYDAGAYRSSKFQVRLPGITLSTVTRGINVGAIYVYENNEYAAKITSNGELIGNVSEDVKNLLEDANDNLLQLAKIYGHETGNCSICGRTLSDPLSIQMGIGPVCAKRFS